MDIESAICNGHLTRPWGQYWREEGWGVGYRGGRVSETKHLEEGRVRGFGIRGKKGGELDTGGSETKHLEEGRVKRFGIGGKKGGEFDTGEESR